MKTTCELCGGECFEYQVLSYRLHDKSIADALRMTMLDAMDFFDYLDEEGILDTMRAIRDVGLEYLTLGQRL